MSLKSFSLVTLSPINLIFRGNSGANNSLPVFESCSVKKRQSLQRQLTLYSSSFVETQRSNDFARVKTTTISNGFFVKCDQHTLICIKFIFQCDCATCPTILVHIFLKFGSDFVQLLQNLLLLTNGSKCSAMSMKR